MNDVLMNDGLMNEGLTGQSLAERAKWWIGESRE